MVCRWVVMCGLGSLENPPFVYDMPGTYLGMVDNASEMRLVSRKEKRARLEDGRRQEFDGLGTS